MLFAFACRSFNEQNSSAPKGGAGGLPSTRLGAAYCNQNDKFNKKGQTPINSFFFICHSISIRTLWQSENRFFDPTTGQKVSGNQKLNGPPLVCSAADRFILRKEIAHHPLQATDGSFARQRTSSLFCVATKSVGQNSKQGDVSPDIPQFFFYFKLLK